MTLACWVCSYMFYVLIEPWRRDELPKPYVCNGCTRQSKGSRNSR